MCKLGVEYAGHMNRVKTVGVRDGVQLSETESHALDNKGLTANPSV